MTTTTTARTVAREFWESWGEGDLDATWSRYVADDIVIHPSSGYEFTRETWLQAEKALHAAFADIRVRVLDQVDDGEKVATRWAVTARQTGEFFGVPSTGRTATLTGTTVDRVRDGKLAEHWAEVGVPQFLQQLAAPQADEPGAGEAAQADDADDAGGAGGLVDAADHVELERLATEVAWRVDVGEAETITELFTQDGSIATLGEPSVGSAAIRAWGRMMDTDSPIPGVRHVLTNFRFVADGPDRAVGTMYITAYLPGAPEGQATLPFAMGRGTDRYARTAQGWRVASRVFEPYFMRPQA